MDTHRMAYHKRRETFIGNSFRMKNMIASPHQWRCSLTLTQRTTMDITFIDRRAVGVNENYSTACECVVSSQAGSEAELGIDELALYLEATGCEKKRKVYDIESQASQFYCDSASNTPAASSRPQPDHSVEEISAFMGLLLMCMRDSLQSLERM
ncbi:hypothetical protein JCGZ_19148 [Jatropha curcas]|uniref:Uncharacterized protein n=1 Tax=Jatropha curcas TaxID=180498 RepID=A0A067K0X9_JATCU|nr:hypothetical protein JCGZ_19148 [Jatropha curcas]